VFEAVRERWQEVPGHDGAAYSKMFISAKDARSQHFDFRLSCYQPKGAASSHRHRRVEQVYYVLEGEGLLTLDRDTFVLKPGSGAFIPPGVEHSIENTGLGNLVFVVATSPGNISSDDW